MFDLIETARETLRPEIVNAAILIGVPQVVYYVVSAIWK